MRKKYQIIISCAVTMCLTIGLLGYLTNLMERKESDNKYADFFGQEADFDVLFMGTSHVLNGIFPMELWNDYGIVSYNFGGHSNQIATSYWIMENALKQTTPKVVVIDCLGVGNNWKISDDFSYLHFSLDAFPTGIMKIKAVWDLLDDPILDQAIASGNAGKNGEPRTKIGLLWDYSVYHSRWNELSKGDFEPDASCEKGAEARIRVVRNTWNKIPPNQKIQGGTVGEEYLRKMIETCQRRGIDVLLTYLPFPANENQQKEANYITDLAKEYGINYLNFLEMDLINCQTDLYDETSHLNPSGARKVTNYLGWYLIEKYGIENRKNEKAYREWYIDYEEYNELKDRQLGLVNDMFTYLMLLSGDNIDITVDLKNKDILKNDWVMELLKNAGIDVSQLNENTDFIIKKAGENSAVYLENFRDRGRCADTDTGAIQFVWDDGKTYGINVNGTEYLKGEWQDNAGMRICVRRGDTVIDNVKFVYTVDSDTGDVYVSDVSH